MFNHKLYRLQTALKNNKLVFFTEDPAVKLSEYSLPKVQILGHNFPDVVKVHRGGSKRPSTIPVLCPELVHTTLFTEKSGKFFVKIGLENKVEVTGETDLKPLVGKLIKINTTLIHSGRTFLDRDDIKEWKFKKMFHFIGMHGDYRVFTNSGHIPIQVLTGPTKNKLVIGELDKNPIILTQKDLDKASTTPRITGYTVTYTKAIISIFKKFLTHEALSKRPEVKL